MMHQAIGKLISGPTWAPILPLSHRAAIENALHASPRVENSPEGIFGQNDARVYRRVRGFRQPTKVVVCTNCFNGRMVGFPMLGCVTNLELQ
jgi:hypothetical protein